MGLYRFQYVCCLKLAWNLDTGAEQGNYTSYDCKSGPRGASRSFPDSTRMSKP